MAVDGADGRSLAEGLAWALEKCGLDLVEAKDAEEIRDRKLADRLEATIAYREGRKPSGATDLLRQAAQIVEERGAKRDRPEGERSMVRAVRALNVLRDLDLTTEDGWHLLQLVKQVRQVTGGHDPDDFLDELGYASLKAEERSGVEVVLRGPDEERRVTSHHPLVELIEEDGRRYTRHGSTESGLPLYELTAHVVPIEVERPRQVGSLGWHEERAAGRTEARLDADGKAWGEHEPRVGQRLYHRRRDLFGRVWRVDADHQILVKYELPWDPNAPAERHPLSEFVPAERVER